MIKNLLKNICLIGFALIGPISLPAGGIQKNFSECKSLNNPKEILLKTSVSLYTFPQTNAKKLTVINSGSSLSILRKWVIKENDVWVRVELSTNRFIDNPNKIRRGWVKA